MTDPETIVHDDMGEFKFDHVYSPHVSNLEIYESINKPMIDKLFQGFNATVFAYGMTGSGKTYTMMGSGGDGGDDDGLIPLSVSYLFSKVIEVGLVGERKFDVLLSYLEIYNERIYDLLDSESLVGGTTTPSRGFGSGGGRNESVSTNELKIRDDSKYGVRVMGLREQRCESSEELMKWIRRGDSHRKTAETDYNARSSRSHAIVLIRLTNTNVIDGTSISSTLSLCDLAGSERATGQQERRKEGAFINKSLLALGTVISKLSAESTAASHGNSPNANGNGHIPYRDSKLTRILQPALSGDSIVTTICTIDTQKESAAETLNTLRFASRAKNVSLHVNRKPLMNSTDGNDKDQRIAKLNKIIEEQQQLISQLKTNGGNKSVGLGLGLGVSTAHGSGVRVTKEIMNPNITLLRAENKVLKYKLENCEKLLDKDTLELQDSDLTEIVDMLPAGVGSLLETKIQGLQSQLRQYRRYVGQLETQLSLTTSRTEADKENYVAAGKNDEIQELRRMLERKDKIITALQSAKRMRDRALKPMS